jgi:hypothetical protein
VSLELVEPRADRLRRRHALSPRSLRSAEAPTRGGLIQEGNAVLRRGAVGMILYTDDPSSTFSDLESYFLPTIFLQGAPSAALLDF